MNDITLPETDLKLMYLAARIAHLSNLIAFDTLTMLNRAPVPRAQQTQAIERVLSELRYSNTKLAEIAEALETVLPEREFSPPPNPATNDADPDSPASRTP